MNVDVLSITMFVSLVLAALGVGLFVWSARERTFQHVERLSILPLQDETLVVRDVRAEAIGSSTGSARGKE